jgi:hypothetical protein
MLKIVYFNPANSRGKYMKPPTKIKLNMECKPEASPKLILPQTSQATQWTLHQQSAKKESEMQIKFYHKIREELSGYNK